MRLLFHPFVLGHDNPEHMENAQRAKAILDTSYKFEEVELIPDWKKYLEIVHDKNYINHLFSKLEEAKESGLTYIDTDTYVSQGTEGALQACISMIVQGLKENENVFLLTRPPGHHSGRKGRANTFTQGFCLVNNVALAAIMYNKPCIILDIDLHHGNGTEDIIKEYENITYISTHGKNIYPGTGYESHSNILNYPLEWNTNDMEYEELFDNEILPVIQDKNPKKVFLSLGFDAHRDDPLSVLDLSLEAYEHVFKRLQDWEVFCVLEGGYNLRILEKGFELLVKTLG